MLIYFCSINILIVTAAGGKTGNAADRYDMPDPLPDRELRKALNQASHKSLGSKPSNRFASPVDPSA